MKLSRLVAACGATVLLAGALPAMAKSVAYFDGPSYLIDWQSTKQRAVVINDLGRHAGNVADDGSQRIITFDAPMSLSWWSGVDACGSYEERRNTEQMVVRDLPGSISQSVEIGAYVVTGGCQDGQRTPFGSLTDEGRRSRRVAMTARPSMTDIQPGLQLAGPGELAWAADFPYPSQDVVTVQPGSAVFRATGHVVPAAINADGWWVFDLGGSQRAFTRLATNAKTGGESWFAAEWVGGKPQRVAAVKFVKTAAGAGFGTVAQASRMWESGFTAGALDVVDPFYLYMYKNGTGDQVNKHLDTGDETRSPTTWAFDGADVVHRRQLGETTVHTRRWVPLRNEGKHRWVMETTVYTSDGQDYPAILPRVGYYLDTGKAVPPAK